jgi:predicted RNase H-like HicB family nuclease
MRLQVVLEPSDEGGFSVYVPALPGCISEGETEDEAMANIREAVELYLEDTDTDRLPSDKPIIIREIAV